MDDLNRKVKVIKLVGIWICSSREERQKIITDSGGVQRGLFLGIPCITLRDTTEWIETVNDGWNVLVSPKENIVSAIRDFEPRHERQDVFERVRQAL